MKQCPKCNQCSVDFDEYFGRFRCFNADCKWMPPSYAERTLRLLENSKCPKEVARLDLDAIGITMTVLYDDVNDILTFDFNTGEPSFDYPSDDARVSWNVGRHTGQLCGIGVCGAKEFGVSEVYMDIVARVVAAKGGSGCLMPIAGRPNKTTIENIRITLRSNRPTPEMQKVISPAVEQAKKELVALGLA